MSSSGSVRLLPALCAAGLFAACSSDPSGPAEVATWDVIQDDILAANCVSCHTSGTSFARQSGLVLTPDAAYDQLVNAAPTNAAAAAAGLVRVSDRGLAGVEQSFLWEKVNAPGQDHFYADHAAYGEIMPLGRAPLTSGQLEFIRRWIAAGAPRSGSVVDVGLLEQTQRYEPEPFAPLPPPADGIQLHLGPFPVIPNHEREVFSYAALDNAEDVFVNSFELAMRPGSHHFILYTYPEYTPEDVIPTPGQLRDLRDDNNSYVDASGADIFDWRQLQYVKPIVISQSRRLDFHLPPGVAMRVRAGTGIDINTHYANATDAPIDGELYVNLHLLPPDQVEHVAQVFALSNFDIDLPAGRTTTLEKEFVFSQDRRIVQLVSHAHDRLVEFTAQITGGPRDGELLYVTYDWEHPAPLRFDPPLQMAQGQGLRIRATYDNQTDRDLRFGFTRRDEMMILYGFYYTE